VVAHATDGARRLLDGNALGIVVLRIQRARVREGPPPQTRIMFMPQSRASSSWARTRADVVRAGNESTGIQLAPLAKIGTPFTRK
jgi:hypothetical protein